MNSTFLYIIFLVTLISCDSPKKNGETANVEITDTIVINIKYEFDDSNKKNAIVVLQLINLLEDTVILMPQPFFIESSFLTKDYPWVLWSTMFTTPNIIYIENNNFVSRYSGDAMYKPYFSEMPILLKFYPKDTVSINIHLSQKISQNFFDNNVNISGAIVYSRKSWADSIASNSTIEIKNMYFKSLRISKSINIEPIEQTEFQNLLIEKNELEKDTSYTKFIWEVFNRKLKFQYVP